MRLLLTGDLKYAASPVTEHLFRLCTIFAMAEIVGLASSIIAIAGAADTALQMAKSIRRLSRDLGAARKDIRKFSREIEAFSSIIGAAHYS